MVATNKPKGYNMKFYTSGLLNKFGFQDGDMIDDLLFENFGLASNLNFTHNVLVKVVVDHVIPKLDQKIEQVIITTIHNPIRAGTVNGHRVDWYNGNEFELTPKIVEVSDQIIIDIAKAI